MPHFTVAVTFLDALRRPQPLSQLPPPSVSEPYKRASEELRANVRVGDSTVVHDTFTLAPSLLYDRARVWALLDDVSLRAFATALPPPAPAPSASAGSSAGTHTHAEMAWFATVNVFSLGAVIANRLELSLMTRFRQWADASGTLARVRGLATSAVEVPVVATFPNAVLAVSPTSASGSGGSTLTLGDAGSPVAAATRPSASPVMAVPPTSGGSGLGLISKHHLAVFWDSLDREERWKIVIGNDPTGAAAMVHGSAIGGGVGGSGGAPGPFGVGSALRFVESGSGGGGSSAKSVTGGGSAKSVSGGKSKRRGGGAAAQRAGTGAASTARAAAGSGGEASRLASAAAASVALPTSFESPAVFAEPVGQDTLGPLPHFIKSAAVIKTTPPLAPKFGGGSASRPAQPIAPLAAASAAASSEGAASETATYATATLQISVGGGRLTSGGSSCASGTFDDDARALPASVGAASRLVIPTTTLVSGSSSAAAVYSGQVSESGEVDESTGHSVGYSGHGPLAQADLFSQGPEQLRHMWPFCLVDKDGVTVVQVCDEGSRQPPAFQKGSSHVPSQDLYLSTLERAAQALPLPDATGSSGGGSSSTNPEGDQARKIGYRLQFKWADSHAMDLIVAEDEARSSMKSGGGSRGGGNHKTQGNTSEGGPARAGAKHAAPHLGRSASVSIVSAEAPCTLSSPSLAVVESTSVAGPMAAAMWPSPSGGMRGNAAVAAVQAVLTAGILAAGRPASPPLSPVGAGTSIAEWLASSAADSVAAPHDTSPGRSVAEGKKKTRRKAAGNSGGAKPLSEMLSSSASLDDSAGGLETEQAPADGSSISAPSPEARSVLAVAEISAVTPADPSDLSLEGLLPSEVATDRTPAEESPATQSIALLYVAAAGDVDAAQPSPASDFGGSPNDHASEGATGPSAGADSTEHWQESLGGSRRGNRKQKQTSSGSDSGSTLSAGAAASTRPGAGSLDRKLAPKGADSVGPSGVARTRAEKGVAAAPLAATSADAKSRVVPAASASIPVLPVATAPPVPGKAPTFIAVSSADSPVTGPATSAALAVTPVAPASPPRVSKAAWARVIRGLPDSAVAVPFSASLHGAVAEVRPPGVSKPTVDPVAPSSQPSAEAPSTTALVPSPSSKSARAPTAPASDLQHPRGAGAARPREVPPPIAACPAWESLPDISDGLARAESKADPMPPESTVVDERAPSTAAGRSALNGFPALPLPQQQRVSGRDVAAGSTSSRSVVAVLSSKPVKDTPLTPPRAASATLPVAAPGQGATQVKLSFVKAVQTSHADLAVMPRERVPAPAVAPLEPFTAPVSVPSEIAMQPPSPSVSRASLSPPPVLPVVAAGVSALVSRPLVPPQSSSVRLVDASARESFFPEVSRALLAAASLSTPSALTLAAASTSATALGASRSAAGVAHKSVDGAATARGSASGLQQSEPGTQRPRSLSIVSHSSSQHSSSTAGSAKRLQQLQQQQQQSRHQAQGPGAARTGGGKPVAEAHGAKQRQAQLKVSQASVSSKSAGPSSSVWSSGPALVPRPRISGGAAAAGSISSAAEEAPSPGALSAPPTAAAGGAGGSAKAWGAFSANLRAAPMPAAPVLRAAPTTTGVSSPAVASTALALLPSSADVASANGFAVLQTRSGSPVSPPERQVGPTLSSNIESSTRPQTTQPAGSAAPHPDGAVAIVDRTSVAPPFPLAGGSVASHVTSFDDGRGTPGSLRSAPSDAPLAEALMLGEADSAPNAGMPDAVKPAAFSPAGDEDVGSEASSVRKSRCGSVPADEPAVEQEQSAARDTTSVSQGHARAEPGNGEVPTASSPQESGDFPLRSGPYLAQPQFATAAAAAAAASSSNMRGPLAGQPPWAAASPMATGVSPMPPFPVPPLISPQYVPGGAAILPAHMAAMAGGPGVLAQPMTQQQLVLLHQLQQQQLLQHQQQQRFMLHHHQQLMRNGGGGLSSPSGFMGGSTYPAPTPLGASPRSMPWMMQAPMLQPHMGSPVQQTGPVAAYLAPSSKQQHHHQHALQAARPPSGPPAFVPGSVAYGDAFPAGPFAMPPPLSQPSPPVAYPSVAQLRLPGPDTGVPLWLEYQLHAEVTKLQQWAVAHAHFRRMQELRVVWDVARIAVEIVPSATVHLFGSFMTGLATPASDVDVLIRGATTAHLSLIAKSLKSKSWISSVVAVPTARVPVIRLVAEPPAIDSLTHMSTVFAADGTVLLGGGGSHSRGGSAYASPALRSRSDGGATQGASRLDAPASSDTFSIGDSALAGGSTSGRMRQSDTVVGLPVTLEGAASARALRRQSGQLESAGAEARSPPPATASPRLLPRRGSISGSLGAKPPPLARSRGSSSDLTSSAAPSGADGAAASPVAPTQAASAAIARGAGWFDASAPIRLDITFETASHHGTQATQLTRVAVGVNASLAPLVLVLKHLLAAHGLNDAFSGGLSSFGLLVLTSCFLAQAQQRDLPHVAQGVRYATLSQDVLTVPEQPLQPYGDGRPFADVVAPYSMLPLELCGSVHDLQHRMLLPLGMPRLPPVLPPHVRVTRVPRAAPVMVEAVVSAIADAVVAPSSAAVVPSPYPEAINVERVDRASPPPDTAASPASAPASVAAALLAKVAVSPDIAAALGRVAGGAKPVNAVSLQHQQAELQLQLMFSQASAVVAAPMPAQVAAASVGSGSSPRLPFAGGLGWDHLVAAAAATAGQQQQLVVAPPSNAGAAAAITTSAAVDVPHAATARHAPLPSSLAAWGSAARPAPANAPLTASAPAGVVATTTASVEEVIGTGLLSRPVPDAPRAVPLWDTVFHGGSDIIVPPQPSLGVLFLRLLRFCSEELNPATTAVTLGGPIPISRGGTPAMTVTDPLTIMDPIEHTSNVGRNCFRFSQVQHVMRDAWQTLSRVGSEAPWGEGTLSVPSALSSAAPGGARSSLATPEFPVLSEIISSLAQLEPRGQGGSGR